MNFSTSQLACKTPTATHPSGRLQDFELGGSQDCFSESNTEFSEANSSNIAYIAQLLSLRSVRHLSTSQQVGRRFILNMLQSLSDLAVQSAQDKPAQVSGWEPKCQFSLLAFLLARSFSPELSKSVKKTASGRPLNYQEIVSIGRWLDRNGLDIRELGMIQPGIFRPQNALPQPKGSVRFQPKFAELINASSNRNIDYLAGAFFGLSQKIQNEEVSQSSFSRLSSQNVASDAGRGEAIASIFGSRVGYQASNASSLKAIAIPNSGGEPLFALSFTRDL